MGNGFKLWSVEIKSLAKVLLGGYQRGREVCRRQFRPICFKEHNCIFIFMFGTLKVSYKILFGNQFCSFITTSKFSKLSLLYRPSQGGEVGFVNWYQSTNLKKKKKKAEFKLQTTPHRHCIFIYTPSL